LAILVTVLRSDLTTSLIAQGVPSAQAHHVASSALSQGRGSTSVIPQFVRADFADAIHVVLWGMAVAAVVALVGLRRGVHVAAAAPQRGSSVAETTNPT
jgi:hypothetical protein